MRQYCEDRKGFLDHLVPGKLVKSTIRISIMQGTQIATQYLNDQLKEDMKRDELVANGQMTQAEANAEADDWAEKEWNKRWEIFPHKFGVALAKYHAITLVMRLYEHIASKFTDEKRLDQLTLDTFEYGKRRGMKGNDGLFGDMLKVSWNANIIAFMADYTVHQVIIVFGFYMYVQKRKSDRDEEGGLLLSFAKKSSLLAVSRLFGLVFASLGGAVGTLMYPGWGTLAGINLGDSIGASLVE